MCLERVEKKTLLEHNNKEISLKICRGSHLCEMTVAKCIHETQKN